MATQNYTTTQNFDQKFFFDPNFLTLFFFWPKILQWPKNHDPKFFFDPKLLATQNFTVTQKFWVKDLWPVFSGPKVLTVYCKFFQ